MAPVVFDMDGETGRGPGPNPSRAAVTNPADAGRETTRDCQPRRRAGTMAETLWQKWKATLRESKIRAHVGDKKFLSGKLLCQDGLVLELLLAAHDVSAIVRGILYLPNCNFVHHLIYVLVT